MLKTFANAWKIEELRKKLLFTLLIILVYRVGANITVPFIDAARISSSLGGSGTMLGFFNTLSGGAFANATLFALGVSPYITASIVIQLLTVAFPKIAPQNEEGKRRITSYTRYATIILSLVTSIGYYLLMRNTYSAIVKGFEGFYFSVVIVACYCAGSALVMWLAEKINDHGIGNGISIILFANIISRTPAVIGQLVSIFQIDLIKKGSSTYIFTPHNTLVRVWGMGGVWRSLPFTLLAVAGMLALIWFVIHISESERRISIKYAKKVSGKKMYGGQSTHLPLKLNMTGVMPIIFANAIVTLPATIAMFANPKPNTFWESFVKFFSQTSWFYAFLTFVLILAFAYFYVAISFNPVEVAQTIQKNGGTVLGLRPGKETSAYIKKVLSRITLLGALALSVISVVPMIVYLVLNIVAGYYPFFYSCMISDLAFGGSSIIIVVGVILETARELESEMTMRHRKGFLE